MVRARSLTRSGQGVVIRGGGGLAILIILRLHVRFIFQATRQLTILVIPLRRWLLQ